MEKQHLSDQADRNNQLLPGTLGMLILKTLASGTMHGAAIANSIHRASEGVLRVEEGALYPALHRLESRGWLDSTWGLSANKRRAKFYRLTDTGAKKLEDENVQWRRVTTAIGKVMEAMSGQGNNVR
jgi:PadR family transcriptional regulator, regulatory protein PadR